MVAKARMFQFKPDGEVTARFAQDGNGMPAPVMQVRPVAVHHGAGWLGQRCAHIRALTPLHLPTRTRCTTPWAPSSWPLARWASATPSQVWGSMAFVAC